MLQDVKAAFVTSILSLAYSLSTSALIFAGPLQPYLGLGTAAALVTATITAFVTALASGFRIAIASPTSTIAAALAVTIAVLNPAFAVLPNERILPTVFAVLALTTIATGSALFAVGQLRMGKIIRYIPYPVVAGFMAISGWLLAVGAFRLTTGSPLSFAALPELTSHSQRVVVALMIGFALLLVLARQFFRNPAVMPSLLIAGVVVTNLVVASIGRTAVPSNLMFKSNAAIRIEQPFLSDMFAHVDWAAVASITPNILAVIFITVLTALLTCSGLEADLDVETDLNRELRVQGAANALAGIAGGYVGLISVGTTMAARAAGAKTKTVGLISAGVCLAALLGGISLVNEVPRFIVGGLQLQIGAGVLWTWCFESRGRMPLYEWLLVLAIVAAAVWLGFLPAVLCGIAGGCVLFTLEMSRVNIVRRVYGLNERSSSVVRAETDLAILAASGSRAMVFELEGFVFFGSARQLMEKVSESLGAEPRWIVLDFTKVTGADSSAATVLARLIKMLHRRQLTLIITAGSARLQEIWHRASFVDESIVLLPDLETALEFAEIAVLGDARFQGPTRMQTDTPAYPSLAGWIARLLDSSELAERLLPLLSRKDLQEGAYVCREGDPTDSLLFVDCGRIGVMVEIGGEEQRVRVFGAQTIAGEQSFVLQTPRSASLKVEADATIYMLSRRSFDDLAATDAAVVVALLRNIICVQAERLNFATRQTAALAR